MVKLETRHLAILKRLAAGDLLMFVRGEKPHAYWYGTAGNDEALHRAALDLWAYGLVETTASGGGDYEFDINDAGHLAIAKAEGR